MSYGSASHGGYGLGLSGIGSSGYGAGGLYSNPHSTLRTPTTYRDKGSPSRLSSGLSPSYSSATIPGTGAYASSNRTSNLSVPSSRAKSISPVPSYSQYGTTGTGVLKTLSPVSSTGLASRHSSQYKPRYGLSTSKSASSLSPSHLSSETSAAERYRNRYGSSSSLPDGGTPSRLSDRSRTTSANSSTTSLNEEGDKDYKKLYLDMKDENERLKKKLGKAENELDLTKVELQKTQRNMRNSLNDSDKRERRALERKLSELEEEVKEFEKLQADNQRLRDENGALIRVISKLSK